MKLVLRLPTFRTPRSRYFLVSGFLHVTFALMLILSPLLGAGSKIPDDTNLVVSMVGSLPAAKPPSAKPKVTAPPVEKKAQPKPEVVRAEPVIPPEPKPDKKKTEPEKPKDPEPEASTATETADAAVTEQPDAGGAAGSEASIATVGLDDLRHAWYRSAVINALHSTWLRPIIAGDAVALETTVEFDIVRNGTAYNPRVVVSSGFPALDRSAQRAVSDASPFPPLPDAWGKSVITAKIIFRLDPGDN